jgi:tRNA A37 threonylcarbamoyladenosine biosynthesis protein TsaE
MDLYRLDDIDSFSSIGWSEILQDPESIVLIEWPQILEEVITPTKIVEIRQLDGDSRVIEIT